MKLDRNKNPGGTGKYALINMRKLAPVIEAAEDMSKFPKAIDRGVYEAFQHLLRKGYITLGNESPGEQFFVMKYKDAFTASGLHAYAISVRAQANANQTNEGDNFASKELHEYADEMFKEAKEAQKYGTRIPD